MYRKKRHPDENNRNNIKLCNVCLASDRTLTALGKIQRVLQEITNRFDLNLVPTSLLCWECIAVLKKVYWFKEKAKKSQILLSQMIGSEFIPQSFSNLRIVNITTTDSHLPVQENDSVNEITQDDVVLDDDEINSETFCNIINDVFNDETEIEINDLDDLCNPLLDETELNRIDDSFYKKLDEEIEISKPDDVTVTDDAIDDNIMKIKEIEPIINTRVAENENASDWTEIEIGLDDLKFLEDTENVSDYTQPQKNNQQKNNQQKNNQQKNHQLFGESLPIINTDNKSKSDTFKNKNRPKKSSRYIQIQKYFLEKYKTKMPISYDELMFLRDKDRNSYHFNSLKEKCDLCVVGVTSIVNHMKNFHQQTRRRIYACDICKMYLKNRSRLTSHIIEHYFKLRCTICGFETLSTISINDHLKSMHNRTFQCLQCDDKFKFQKPKTGAERVREYRERMKMNNPEKYEELTKSNFGRMKQNERKKNNREMANGQSQIRNKKIKTKADRIKEYMKRMKLNK